MLATIAVFSTGVGFGVGVFLGLGFFGFCFFFKLNTLRSQQGI